jgi:Tfp pilus assembly protein PilN
VRPVNLIPADQRRSARGEGGAGISLATRAFLGVLALAVLLVGSLVLISNQVNSKQSELADLSRKKEAASAAGNALRPYGNFVKLQQARTGTVTGLARSRFNWERVLRQLSHTVAPNVWITNLSGSVSAASSSSSGSAGAGGGGTLRSNVQGPAVNLQGCASSQRDSARMMARMRTLDGVSSVTLTRSELPDTEGGGAAGGSGGSAGGGAGAQACPRYQFDMLVAFKAQGVLAPAPGAQAQPASAGATGATGSTGSTGSTGAQGSGAGGTGQ